jgi:hypothetical protein
MSEDQSRRGLRRTLAGVLAVLALAASGTVLAQPAPIHRGPYYGSADRPPPPGGQRFRDMPPEQRRQVLRDRFEALPADEQARIRERIRYEREMNGGPLTPEQRRQLRRDVLEHGREVYGPRQQPGRRE